MLPKRKDKLELSFPDGSTRQVEVTKEHSLCRHYTIRDKAGVVWHLFLKLDGEEFYIAEMQ